jgi:hypothetical protein
MSDVTFLNWAQLEAGLDHVRLSPKDYGPVEMIVIRPQPLARRLVAQADVNADVGVVGDCWAAKPSSATGKPNPEAQVTLMNSRFAQHIAGTRERMPLAGDQLYVDFDLSEDNVPPGTQLRIGSALLEVSATPHNGCKKFLERFGPDGMPFVNSPEGKRLHLRGINCKVIEAGTLSVGDKVTKVPGTPA